MPGAKQCSTDVLDSIFAYIYGKTTGMAFCVMTSSGPSAGIVAASSPSSAFCLALAPTTGLVANEGVSTAYYTLGSSGLNRYMTIGACSCDEVLWTGAACVVAIVRTSSSIAYVTTCSCQLLTAGNKVNIGTWTITVNQPT